MNAPPVDQPFRELLFIFGALLMGMVSFGVVAIVMVGREAVFSFEAHQAFQLVAALLLVFSVPMSLFLFRVLMKNAQRLSDASLAERAYMTACIVRWALLEGPALFCCVAVLLTRNLVFLAPLVVLLLFFLAAYPSRARFEAFAGQGTGARLL